MSTARTAPILLWFRQDLRLADNPALHAAAGCPLLPVYVLDDGSAGRWALGGASRWWLHHSLAALRAELCKRGLPLLLARGRAEAVVPALAEAVGASEVFAGRMHEPWSREADRRVEEALRGAGRALRLFTSATLRAPAEIATGDGRPYSMYAPFAKAALKLGPPGDPLPVPKRLRAVSSPPEGVSLDALRLLPQPPEPDWAAEFGALWQPGEAGARARLERFLQRPFSDYPAARNDPGIEGSSGLSPHLRWGEISARQVWQAALHRAEGKEERARPFLNEVLWREFSLHLLWHRPEMPDEPLRPLFARFPFAPDARLLRAWQRGRTGFPIVDAGMRQLWRLGWMHNRVRMVAASFLVKHLLQPWQDGAAWFWDTLVDADLANNSMSWQWIAGSGSDAAPYFRVFSPVAQGEKFDPAGRYVRRFVPELARLPDGLIHRPWEAPAAALSEAGIVLGRDYPRPIVEHAAGRRRALDAFAAMRRSAAGADAA
jgi:deoxyribodipyrimidine photo-lyase